MEEKYILSEQDVIKLSPKQQEDYERFFNTIYSSGVVYQAQLEKVDEILQQQYKSGVLFNPNNRERYPKILAENVNYIINAIIKYRNDVINETHLASQFGFQYIAEGLDVLKKHVERYMQSPHYQGSIGYDELRDLLPRIDQLKAQIIQDMNFYKGYKAEKDSAIANYKVKKQAYDNLSLFGKFAAKINGTKKEMLDARQMHHYYNSSYPSSIPQPGEIVNPYQYDEYLKSQQLEQSDGEMKR